MTAPQPDVPSTVELSGRVVGQHELAPATAARDRPRSCVVAKQRTDDRDIGPGAGRSGPDRGRADLPGMLRPWGYGRSRTVRDHGLTTLTLRPRRGRCVACGITQVLLLGSVLPRCADTTVVIGSALLASARGAGYRRIAVDIARPLSTVRRWLRSVRGGHTEWLYAQGVVWIHRVDSEVFATITPRTDRARRRADRVGRRRPSDPGPAHPARVGLDPDRPAHPRAPRPGPRRLTITPRRVPARPRPAATVPTSGASIAGTQRHPADHSATITITTARDARFSSARPTTPRSACSAAVNKCPLARTARR